MRLSTAARAAGLATAGLLAISACSPADVQAWITARKPPKPPTTTTTGAPPSSTSTTIVSTTSSSSPTTAPDSTTTTAPPATTTPPPSTTSPDAGTTTTTAAPGASGCGLDTTLFCEDFTDPAGMDRFDWELHVDEFSALEPSYIGEHDHACHGPDTYRTVTAGQRTGPGYIDVADSDLIWHCAPGGAANGHVMTAVNTGGVATLSFAPKQAFRNIHEVCWEQNMNSLGGGKWANLHVVPAADVDAHGGDLNYAAGLEVPFGGIPLQPPPGAFNFSYLNASLHGYVVQPDGSQTKVIDKWGAWEQNMETSPAPRYRFCIEDLENGHLRVTAFQKAQGTYVTDTFDGALPDGDVRVIWQDAAYNPDKHDSTGHLTWHWDTLAVV